MGKNIYKLYNIRIYQKSRVILINSINQLSKTTTSNIICKVAI